MPKVVFWSPVTTSIGQTHASIAISTLMAIEGDYSNLLIHGHWQSKKIESSFTQYAALKAQNVFNNASLGITALARLVESNKLTPESIRNYAKPVLKQRLDVMYGTNVATREQFNALTESFPMVIEKSGQAYDLVWVDLPKGNENSYVHDILKGADFVVITLFQEEIFLEEAIEKYLKSEDIKDKPKLLLMCNYEEKSKYNIPNIRRKLGIQEQIYTIPHNYLFTDACNDGAVVDFFYKNLAADKTDYNGKFIAETRSVVKKVLENVKV